MGVSKRRSHGYERVAWASPAMRNVEADIACAVRYDLNVLITGEAGVGKRSIAHRIHRESSRAAAPLTVARMLDAPEFGDRIDEAVRQALPAGTALLEHAERISPALQLRLQSCLECWAVRRPGRAPSTHGSVRLLTTSNTELFAFVRRGGFSETLFYRLNTIHVMVPPLRDRPEDIPLLLDHFLCQYGQAAPRISAAAQRRLVEHPWPGNVGELRALACTLASHDASDGTLKPDDLPPGIAR